jgi:hypothetical protein
MLLRALNEPLDRLAPIPHAGADLYEIRRLSKEPTPPNRSDGHFQEPRYFPFGE